MFSINFSKFRLLLLFGLVALITGCATPQQNLSLGISTKEWSNFDPELKQQMVKNYQKITVERLPEIKTDQKKPPLENLLEVNIHDGEATFPPLFDSQKYQPFAFTISQDECKEVALKSIVAAEKEGLVTQLGVCYVDKTLYLDHSHYDLTKKMGSISIHSSPLWLSGFNYKGINSTGYVRLKNATVEIKQQVN